MYKCLILLSFSSFLCGMHETDDEFIARVRQKVENGADDRSVINLATRKCAWILCDKVTQKDVLRYDDAAKSFAPRKIILSKTKDGYRAFYVDFNRQLTQIIVFYRVDEYDIIDVNKMEYDI